jgi:hypothetical protein
MAGEDSVPFWQINSTIIKLLMVDEMKASRRERQLASET